MDTDALIAHARAKFDHAIARKVMQEKYQARMIFGWNGGMFRTSPELITFLSLYGDEEIVMPDLYENPIKFKASDVCNIMRAKWQEQMNAWLVEHSQLSRQR
jgi:hypothetical protein